MRIVFVRHGEPDYEHDCLTETGRLQAQAAAERLEREGISRIYASPMGRASQTAACTAERLGLKVETLEWMHEITWGGKGLPENGHPWTLSDWLFDRDGFAFDKCDWRQHPYFDGNACVKDLDRISAAFDQLLVGHGYRHEGVRFLCNAEQEETFALFSHGGSGACVLSHLLALPFPYLCTVMPYDFTSIIILSFPVRQGEYVHPRIELFNDAAHIRNIRSGIRFQKDPDAK